MQGILQSWGDSINADALCALPPAPGPKPAPSASPASSFLLSPGRFFSRLRRPGDADPSADPSSSSSSSFRPSTRHLLLGLGGVGLGLGLYVWSSYSDARAAGRGAGLRRGLVEESRAYLSELFTAWLGGPYSPPPLPSSTPMSTSHHGGQTAAAAGSRARGLRGEVHVEGLREGAGARGGLREAANGHVHVNGGSAGGHGGAREAQGQGGWTVGRGPGR